jgi:hypothetical protein
LLRSDQDRSEVDETVGVGQGVAASTWFAGESEESEKPSEDHDQECGQGTGGRLYDGLHAGKPGRGHPGYLLSKKSL